ERRERAPFPAAETEEIREEAERDRRDRGERDRAGTVRRLRTAFFRRSKHGASERDDGADRGQRSRPLAGRDRDRERHDRAAGDDRGDDAHRPQRQRLVEGGEPRSAADAREHADPQRALVEAASGYREGDE